MGAPPESRYIRSAGMTKGQNIVRNAAALMASQPLTWALTLIFAVEVPRNVGPSEWGEWIIAWAVGNLAKAVLDFGVNTVLFKSVSRRSKDAERPIGVVLMLRLLLSPVLVLGMVGFSIVANYSEHTRLVVALVGLSLAAAYVATPVVFGLQAFEKMHLTAAGNVLSSLILTAGAVVLVKLFALGIIAICTVAVASQVAGLILQWVWLRRSIRFRPTVDWHLLGQLLKDGLPYWATFSFFTLYALLDGVLLSLLGSTHENGWYGVAVQMIATLGFLPYAVTTAVFPSLSRSIHTDREESAKLAGRSFRLLVTLSLPMAVGLALVSHNVVTTIYGAWFSPAADALTVLALTLPPVYIATLVNGFVIAADRQIQWTWVMAGMCALNLPLNLFTIPYFHSHIGNGALGAALALLATDFATGVAALFLLPSSLRAAVASTLPAIARSALATIAMAAVVWPLRGVFLPIPILAGGGVFAVLAYVLRVIPTEELHVLAGLARKLARKPLNLFRRPVQADVVADVEVA
jgi:O-antigen/teichoic acid export membrane protein